ncbi:family 16 glycosylhydrolase [Winogradskyella pulchriflava]|uniref:Family 16 glycosylhydrolase n=1 Tax=Winogradskyella pulchriflava TaxID=1110688 RepID=A0ABV6Q6I8_9FLAO
MKLYKLRTYITLPISLLLLVIWSCSSDSSDDDSGGNTVSNLVVTVEVVGSDASNPNGDGSGVVNVTATANNAINYGFKFGNGLEQASSNGIIQHTFTEGGTNTYNITVKAYSSAGESISSVETVTVYVDETIVVPSNLTLTASVQGFDNDNPYGDGSGVVNFTAQADDAVSYGYSIDGSSEVQSTNGTYQFTFNSVEGVENHTITVVAYSSTNDSIDTSETIAVSYYVGSPPVWADEFFQDGSPNSNNWTYDLGAGGWGNNEAQTYTSNASNVIVEDGLLKITAKSEGAGYTSSRLKSQGLFQFTYGRVDVRAKLPASAGTWPAIWMLGSNFPSEGWPRCGEIDIMEQTGWDKNKTLGTCHWFNTANSSTASYGLETSVLTSTSEFHVYSLVWDANSIKILVDDVQFFVMNSNSASIPSSPFESDFFIILNVAMGGSLGGDIPDNFTQDSMEIDYVRVYE